MIVAEELENGFVRIVSDNNKYLNDITANIFNVYIEVVNKGVVSDGNVLFDNGHIYEESEMEIEL
jgi:hypothetical protein